MKKQSNQTMSGNLWRRGLGFLTAILPTALLIAVSGEIPVHGDTLATNMVSLEPQTTGRTAFHSSILVSTQAIAFKKEPAITGKIIRGVLKFSDEATNAIAFLWQRDTGKLNLDLNRNEDLTDDPAGVLSTDLAQPRNYQIFPNVPLTLATPAGRCALVADLSFWDYGNRPSCSVAWRSYWQGKMNIAGLNWQVGVMPTVWVGPNGHRSISFENHLLLRSWDRRSEPINVGGASADAIPFSKSLFFGGHSWQLAMPSGRPESEFKPTLTFAEQAATLGDLKITGKFIRRLTAQGDGCLLVLDQPGETVKVPVGNYTTMSVLLEQGGAQAFATDSRSPKGNHFTVTEKFPGTLIAGGPLTNSVAVTRHGQDLRMDYLVLGAGGQVYQLASQDRSHPPEFAIFKGEKKIASGTFEFG
jgi:hypothetical protein